MTLVGAFLVLMSLAANDSVVTEDLMIPMARWVKLQARLYKDRNLKQSAPVLLRRFLFDNKRYEFEARRFAAERYIALIQDCSGRNGSEGVHGFYFAEGPADSTRGMDPAAALVQQTSTSDRTRLSNERV